MGRGNQVPGTLGGKATINTEYNVYTTAHRSERQRGGAVAAEVGENRRTRRAAVGVRF